MINHTRHECVELKATFFLSFDPLTENYYSRWPKLIRVLFTRTVFPAEQERLPRPVPDRYPLKGTAY